MLKLPKIEALPLTTPVLDARQRNILEAIVECYNQTAEPVSSRRIARDYEMGLSAATIRNTMADLEDLGYVTQPHTSAGRIPTEQGYRVYVDSMMTTEELSLREKQRIQDGYVSSNRDFEEIMEQTSKILSETSHYTGIAVSPELDESVLHRLELISIDSKHILAILLMASGVVKNQVVPITDNLSDEEVSRMSRIFNEKFAGLPLKQIRQTAQLKAVFDQYPSEPMAVVVHHTLSLDSEIHVYIDGASNFFSQPEFGDIQKIEPLFRVLERKEQVADLLSAPPSEFGTQVLIGSESGCEGMEMCSIVRSNYRTQGNQFGTIGVIGPTRMAYPRVVSIVKFTAEVISQFFEPSLMNFGG
ncbi:MAG: heat-inducible transcriptional repressor HrcA [Candidatus Poribacteria bacterium]|nr:heat-inducible transcriptional repressor HrcA [Candidatus Poribacteria bacterium]